jgi:hypothetical protein
MKKTFFRILLAVSALWTAIGNFSCTNEYEDMLPGEMRLKENDYRNNDEIHDIEYATADGTANMSALEVRTIWHAVVIGAEKNLEYDENQEKRIYGSPVEAEESFYRYLKENMATVAEKYPYSHAAIIKELKRAEVHTYVHYVWCAYANEYINLEFKATPESAETAPPTE